jgi:hypothetical protein
MSKFGVTEPEMHEYQRTLVKTAHVTLVLEGPDVDQMDILGTIMASAEEMKFNLAISSGNVNIYYKKKE